MANAQPYRIRARCKITLSFICLTQLKLTEEDNLRGRKRTKQAKFSKVETGKDRSTNSEKLTMIKVEDELCAPGINLGRGVVDGDGTVHGVISEFVAGEGGFSAEKPIREARSTEVPSSGPDASTVLPAQLTIFFGGNVSVFDGISAEKIQEIIRIAAKSIETENSPSISPVASPALTRAPSFSSTSTAASPAAQLFPIHPISFCRSAADLPIARRHSLQRFLEKRRDRLVSKNPYPASDMKTDVPRDNATIKEEYPTA